jgi:serine/threonine-protein kinase
MDADLARVARGASVSNRTEEALTRVMAADTAAATAIVPRGAVTPVPAPPAYRPPSYYEDTGRRRSPWPMILGLVAVAIAAVGGYLVYQKVNTAIDKNAPVAVQNVEQSPVKNAELILHQQGLQTHTVEHSSTTVAEGLVISQNPSPGTRVAKGTLVTLTASSGAPKVAVPALTGLSQAAAQTTLENAGLKMNVHYVPSADVPEGTVTASSPGKGTTVLVGSTVDVNVSSGPKQVGVPGVVGQPYENAAGQLKGAGFNVSRVDVANAAPVDQVVSQSPSGGTTVAKGSTVTLSVSKGPETVDVPSVTGNDVATAKQRLQQAGLSVSVIEQDVTDPTQDGLVLAQSPTHGKLQQGSTVTITVGKLVTVTQPATTPTTPATPTTTTAATTTTTAAAVTTTTTPTTPTTSPSATTITTTTTPTTPTTTPTTP